MNNYKAISIAILGIALNITDFMSASDTPPTIPQIIEKAQNRPSHLRPPELDTLCDYLCIHWYEKDTDQIAKNIDSLLNNPNIIKQIIHIMNSQSITTILAYQQSYLIPFLKAAFENPATPLPTIQILLKYAQTYGITIPVQYNIEALKIRIKKFFTKKQLTITAKTLVMIVFYKYMFHTLPTTMPWQTPTIKHAIAHADTLVNSDLFLTYSTNPLYLSMIDSIITKEQELAAKGYYTFIHGQRWQYRLIEQWFTKLWEVKFDRSAQDFIFMHCEKPCLTKAQLEQESLLRNNILAYGGEASRSKLLFLNYAFFGNEDRTTSCSAYYLLHNFNSLTINITRTR